MKLFSSNKKKIFSVNDQCNYYNLTKSNNLFKQIKILIMFVLLLSLRVNTRFEIAIKDNLKFNAQYILGLTAI